MTRMELEELRRQREIGQETTIRRLKQRLSENAYQLDDITIETEEEKLD
jgi:tRNA splicing endonuclease